MPCLLRLMGMTTSTRPNTRSTGQGPRAPLPVSLSVRPLRKGKVVMPKRMSNKVIDRNAAIRKVANYFSETQHNRPERISGKNALVTANELYLSGRNENFSKWYLSATDAEIKHFIDAWNAWRKPLIKERKKMAVLIGYDAADDLSWQSLAASAGSNTVCTGQERVTSPEAALPAPTHSPAQGG